MGVADTARIQPVRPRGLSTRAVLLGLAATPLNAYWLTYVYWHFGYLIDRPSLIYYNCVFYLVGLVAVNALLRRWRPTWAFSAGELLTVYLMLSLATAWCGVDFLTDLPEAISNPFWFAAPSNQWDTIVLPYLPGWLTVSDVSVISGLYEGYSTFYRGRVVLAWLGPTLWWTGMATALMLAFVCLSSILRRRWSDEDKLLFPAATVPLQIAERRHGLFRSRLFWIGLLLAAGLEVVNTVHGLRPAVPAIPFYFDIGPYLQGMPPWNAIRQTGMELRPLGVAICYLMPLDLIFSLWLFNLMFKAQILLASHLGWTTNIWTGFPYVDNQGLGGLIALLAGVIWLDRHYVRQVVRKVLGLTSPLDDSGEAFSYRGAVLGLAVALGFLIYLFSRGGMRPPLTLFWAAHFLLLGLAATRIRAQLAPPTLELWWIGPNHFLPMVIGSRSMSRQAQGIMWLTYPVTREFNSNPQPWTLEGFKLADAGRVSRRRTAWLMVAITPVAAMSVFWATLHVVYGSGVASNADPGGGDHALDVPELLANALQNPIGPDYAALGAVTAGVVSTAMLMALKMRFVGWPLHPVALPIACAWVTDEYLPAIFTAWVVKAVIMRYGGLRLHRQGLTFFVGVIVGAATATFLRTILAWALDTPLS
jgi:hypothetical protein